jgi:hypothetical protein
MSISEELYRLSWKTFKENHMLSLTVDVSTLPFFFKSSLQDFSVSCHLYSRVRKANNFKSTIFRLSIITDHFLKNWISLIKSRFINVCFKRSLCGQAQGCSEPIDRRRNLWKRIPTSM